MRQGRDVAGADQAKKIGKAIPEKRMYDVNEPLMAGRIPSTYIHGMRVRSLRHRAGNGLVFSSAHLSDDQALAELMPHLLGDPQTEPRRIPFRPGRRSQAWAKNCVAIGL
jgi:hypothetical protein